MEALGFSLFMGVLFWYEWALLRVRGGRGERIAFCVFMALAFGLGLATILDLPLPSPTKGIERVFRPFTFYG